jgi:hypothetical protein
MKIILNPKTFQNDSLKQVVNNASIKDVWFNNQKYFEEPLVPGKMVKVDDELGEFLVGLYGFLEILTSDEAKDYLTKKPTFLCKECGVEFGIEKPYLEHLESHEKEKLDDGLGIPVITSTSKEEVKVDTQKLIEQDNLKDGLDIGEGLVDESFRPSAKF